MRLCVSHLIEIEVNSFWGFAAIFCLCFEFLKQGLLSTAEVCHPSHVNELPSRARIPPHSRFLCLPQILKYAAGTLFFEVKTLQQQNFRKFQSCINTSRSWKSYFLHAKTCAPQHMKGTSRLACKVVELFGWHCNAKSSIVWPSSSFDFVSRIEHGDLQIVGNHVLGLAGSSVCKPACISIGRPRRNFLDICRSC